MKEQLEKIRAEAAWSESNALRRYEEICNERQHKGAVRSLDLGRWQQAKSQALIDRLIRVVERQDEALDFYSYGEHFATPDRKNNLTELLILDRGETAVAAQADAMKILEGE